MNPSDKQLDQKLIEAISANSDEKLTADSLVESILNSGVVLFHDQYEVAYMSLDGTGRDIYRIKSDKGKLWIQNYAYTNHCQVIGSDILKRATQTLEGQAIFGSDEHKLHVRVFSNDDGLLYDLGKSAVLINPSGWEIIDKPPIVFKRFSHHKPQVNPIKNGDVKLLFKYINIADKDSRLLLLAYVISSFIPNFPHPLLILYGPQGAGKTTPMMVMKSLIDPSAMITGSSAPTKYEELIQILSHHAFIFFDNLSKMPEWFSDALARAATGDSFSKRELYSDDDDVIYHIQLPIALNGINQVVYKSDLLDRSILLELERISPKKRKEYQAFWSEFEKDQPAILGGIFDVLAKAMKLYPNVKLSKLPRMADFARWGYAITEAAGFKGEDFIKAYSKNIDTQHEEAIYASPVAQTILALMEDRLEWHGTPAELYKVLQAIATNELELGSSKGWPTDAARLSKALSIILPNLQAKGIYLDRKRSKERLITITKTTVDTDATDA